MTISRHLCLRNTFWIQGHRDVTFNNTLYLRWKFWVSVGLIAFERETDKWNVPIILNGCRFLFLCGVCSASPSGVAFLREQEMHSLCETIGMAMRAQRPNSQIGIPLTYRLFIPPVPGDILLTVSAVAFFSPFASLGPACKEVLSTLDLRHSWMAAEKLASRAFWPTALFFWDDFSLRVES